MKKIIALLLSLSIVFLLSSCGKKTAVDPETTASTSAVVAETTEKQLPYWDTHEIGTYAGLINGGRFSGDFGEFIQDVKCKNGDVVLRRTSLVGMRETDGNPAWAAKDTISYPDFHVYYNASAKRYTSAWDYYWEPYEAKDSCDKIVVTKCDDSYYYSETSCVIDNLQRIEANDEYVVRIYERSWKDGTESRKTVDRYYWKKDSGFLGVYIYDDSTQPATEINIRFTSKTADGWKMDETIVPTALEGSERTWPEKLWPEEYKGLDDPELLAILNEY